MRFLVQNTFRNREFSKLAMWAFLIRFFSTTIEVLRIFVLSFAFPSGSFWTSAWISIVSMRASAAVFAPHYTWSNLKNIKMSKPQNHHRTCSENENVLRVVFYGNNVCDLFRPKAIVLRFQPNITLRRNGDGIFETSKCRPLKRKNDGRFIEVENERGLRMMFLQVVRSTMKTRRSTTIIDGWKPFYTSKRCKVPKNEKKNHKRRLHKLESKTVKIRLLRCVFSNDRSVSRRLRQGRNTNSGSFALCTLISTAKINSHTGFGMVENRRNRSRMTFYPRDVDKTTRTCVLCLKNVSFLCIKWCGSVVFRAKRLLFLFILIFFSTFTFLEQ